MGISAYIIIAIMIVLTARISLDINLEYDILANLGKIKIKLFRIIPLFIREISLVGKYFELVHKKKVLQIKLDLSDKNIRFLRTLNESLSKKMYIDYVSGDFNIGFQDPYTCSVICGYIHSIAGTVLSKIKNARPDTTVKKTVNIGYFQNIIQFTVKFKFEITLFDYIWATVAAFYKSRREVENG